MKGGPRLMDGVDILYARTRLKFRVELVPVLSAMQLGFTASLTGPNLQ